MKSHIHVNGCIQSARESTGNKSLQLISWTVTWDWALAPAWGVGLNESEAPTGAKTLRL